MSSERKRRGPFGWLAARTWRFWLTVVICMPVLYVVSLGPMCWLAGDNDIALEILPNVYYPILWLARAGRPATGLGRTDQWIEWYSTVGRNDEAWPLLAADGQKFWIVPPDPDPDSEE